MPISSLSSVSPIQPTKPRNAYLAQATPVANTYYTLLTIASGKGILSKVILGHYGTSTWYDNSQVTIRITVDGGTAQTFTGSSSNGGYLRGFPQGNYSASGANVYPVALYNLGFQSPTYFYQSLLVEIMTTTTSSGTLYGTCDYSLV